MVDDRGSLVPSGLVRNQVKVAMGLKPNDVKLQLGGIAVTFSAASGTISNGVLGGPAQDRDTVSLVA